MHSFIGSSVKVTPLMTSLSPAYLDSCCQPS